MGAVTKRMRQRMAAVTKVLNRALGDKRTGLLMKDLDAATSSYAELVSAEASLPPPSGHLGCDDAQLWHIDVAGWSLQYEPAVCSKPTSCDYADQSD